MSEFIVNAISIVAFALSSIIIYIHARRKPIPLSLLVPFCLFSAIVGGYAIYFWLSRDIYYYMYPVPSLPYMYSLIFFMLRCGISLLELYADASGESTNYYGTKILMAVCLATVTAFAPYLTVKTLKIFTEKYVHFRNENTKELIVRFIKFIERIAKKILKDKRRIYIKPQYAIFISSAQGGLFGIGFFLVASYVDIILTSEYSPELIIMAFMVMIGPWHFLLRLVAAFAIARPHYKKALCALLEGFPSPRVAHCYDLRALYKEYTEGRSTTARLPRFARLPRRAGGERAEPPRLAEEDGCLVSEAMGRMLALVMMRQMQQQLDLGRTVMVLGPAAWLDALSPLVQRGARNTGASILHARQGRCVGHGVPRLIIADFQTLGVLAERWPANTAGTPLAIDLLVAVGLEHASSRLRVEMAMIRDAMGGAIPRLWAQAKPRQQSEATVRDLLLWSGPLTEIAIHPPRMRWPDYLLIWADTPTEVPPDPTVNTSTASNSLTPVETGSRPDAALRLAAMARRRKIPCTFADDPAARDADALEQLWCSHPERFGDPGLRLPDTVFRYRPGPVHIVHSHGNLADVLNAIPACATATAVPWMLHVLTTEAELPAPLAARISDGSPPPDRAALAPWEPLAPQPLGSVVEWARALRRMMARPRGLGLSELETIFLNCIPPGIVDGFGASHALGGAVGMVEQVFGPASDVRLALTTDGATRLFASPEPPEPRPPVICLNESLPHAIPLDLGDCGLTYAPGTLVRYGGKTFRVDHVGPDRISVHHEEPREPVSRREYRFDRSYRLESPPIIWERGPYRGLVTRNQNIPMICGHFHAPIRRRTEGYREFTRNAPAHITDVALPEPIEVARRFVSAGWFRPALPASMDPTALRTILTGVWQALHWHFPGLTQRCAVIFSGADADPLQPFPFCTLENPDALLPASGDSTESPPYLLIIEDSETDLGVVRALIRHPEFLAPPPSRG